MIHPYFRETVKFFREVGRRLAQVSPRNADMLGRRGYDPDVERLLEGLAFLTGKVYERQHRTLDEICQLACDVLFPHYLRLVPAATIVQFDPPGADVLQLPRGTEVLSVPVLGTQCRFRTTHTVALDDLEITGAGFGPAGSASQLYLTFAGPAWEQREPDSDAIRLHLHGEGLLTRQLYQWLCSDLEGVDLVDAQNHSLGTVPVRVKPVGFGDDEALLDYPPGGFAGFRLLQEYFALPDKFMFVDLCGVWSALKQRELVGPFGLRFRFSAAPPPSLVVSADNVRLRCAPVVNLFSHTADPIRRDPLQVDFRVRPAGPHLHYEICSVLAVVGYGPRQRVGYPSLADFDSGAGSTFCQVVRRLRGGEVQTYLSPQDGETEIHAPQTLVIDLLCSNGKLTTALGVGDLRECAEPYPWLGCENITALSRPASPPMGSELRRHLVMLLSLAQRDLASLEAIREAIELHAFHATHERQRARAVQGLCQTLVEAQTETTQRRHGRVPVWGRQTKLVLDETGFDTAGEIFLFSAVINEYIARQAPINCFTELIVRERRSGREWRWPARLGRQLL